MANCTEPAGSSVVFITQSGHRSTGESVRTDMLTLHYRLTAKPDVNSFDDRDYRRQLAVLIEDKAVASVDGLNRLAVSQADVLGDPIELAFEFKGNDETVATAKLKPFLESIETVARSHRSMTKLHRSAVIRPVEEFTEAGQDVAWPVAFEQVRRLASRDTLGPLFLEVDPRMSSEADSTVVFAFSGYRFQNNAAWVDRFARLMRPKAA